MEMLPTRGHLQIYESLYLLLEDSLEVLGYVALDTLLHVVALLAHELLACNGLI